MKQYLAIFLCLLIGSSVFAQKVKLSVKTLPSAVVENFREANPDAHISRVWKVTTKKQVSFEIDFKEGDAKKTAILSEDGKPLSMKEIITIEKLPPAVSSAIAKKYPDARIMKIRLISTGSGTEYEVELHEKKKKMEVVFSSAGNVVKKS
jgi:hypothetical protein